ncbi:hypothetical protein CDL12_09649 [Handroanthus impetiginosus]|uniref:BHLH domain-containing protein n=1 Tax=Handroanthus impetiginosus TaxID=429701 RepID=A0A2G9HJH9_9LAMI|nr:hypothetical protein CDL12_09649 [Handroanthus impetiginosus]
MVTAKESETRQLFSAWNLSYLDHMAFLGIEQNHGLPCFRPYTPTANVAFPGRPGLDLNTGQQDSVGRFLKLIPPNSKIVHPTGNPCPKDAQCALPHRLGDTDKPMDTPQKRFLIFDQSGSHTRLFVSPLLSHENQIFTPETPHNATDASREEVAVRPDQQFLMKPIVEEKWDENHLTDEEGEMPEDTEEINALLYSDSDDEYDDNDDENDEVTSTGHSPFIIKEEVYNKHKLLQEFEDEVASSQGPSKRQRLLDGKCKKSSLMSDESPTKRAISYEDDVESSCAGLRASYDRIDSSKREKKVKIRQAMKVLETIIPGISTNNDPLFIIDKAIAHLKSMKTEVEAHGFSHPGYESSAFP